MRDHRSTVEVVGLWAFRTSSPQMSRAHLHPELELNLMLSGSARYVTAAGQVELPVGRLVAFWGGYPHRLLASPDAELLGVTLPLSEVSAHPLLGAALHRLLRGEVLDGGETGGPRGHDEYLMHRWCRDLTGDPAPQVVELCLLELRARLARLAVDELSADRSKTAPDRSAERLLAAVAGRYTDRVSVPELARAAGVNPTYAAATFKRTFGMPLWRYVTALRVAHACRLLTTTDWTVDTVGHASGFGSRASFHRAFRDITGCSPGEYRATQPGHDAGTR